MKDLDRPDLGPLAYEEIEQAQHEIDTRYWKALREMQVPSEALQRVFALHSGEPRPPKRPEHLRVLIHSYARELFRTEANRYPVGSQLSRWLLLLKERVTVRIMGSIQEIEKGQQFRLQSLAYHGLTESDMRQAVNEALRPLIGQAAMSNQSGSGLPLQYPETRIPDAPQYFEPAELGPDEHGEIGRRKRLLAEYKAATHNPSNKKIYEARNSGIYKPQFYQWLDGTLSAHSATAVNFERFLTNKKPPIPRRPKD